MSEKYLLFFKGEQEIRSALQKLEAENHFHFEAYTSHELDPHPEIIDEFRFVKLAALTGAIVGLSLAHFFQWYANTRGSPLDIGGRPLNSWPAFIPIDFVFTVLCTGLATFAAFLFRAKLPTPYDPVFEAPSYDLSLRPYSILIWQKALSLHPLQIEQAAPALGANHWEVLP